MQVSIEWRRGGDLNPRDPFESTRVPGVRLKPLGHLSAAVSQYAICPRAPASRVRRALRGTRDYCGSFGTYADGLPEILDQATLLIPTDEEPRPVKEDVGRTAR